MFGHACKFVTVSDEAAPAKEFKGLLLDEEPGVGEFAHVATFVTDAANGFGWGVGCVVDALKHLGDGKYGK